MPIFTESILSARLPDPYIPAPTDSLIGTRAGSPRKMRGRAGVRACARTTT